MSDVQLSDLSLTLRCMKQQGEDIGYVALSEITDRNRSVGAARVDFSAVGLGPWLKRDAGEEDEPDDAEESADEEEGPTDEPDYRDALAEGIVPTSQLAVAAMRWLVETVAALMAGRTDGKFKVGLWSPGGKTLLHSSRFEAKNPNARRRMVDEEADVEAERRVVASKGLDLTSTVQPPPPRPGPTAPEERVWQALGDGYTQLISLTQSTYSHIAKLQSAEIQSLSAQNKRLHDTLENVSNDLRNVHIGTAEAQRDEVSEAAAAKVREELGKQFIEQLGAGVRAYIATKAGLPPEVAEVVDVLGASPDLVEALKLPNVRAMLKEPAFVKELAEMLKSIGPPSPTPSPGTGATTPTTPTEGAPHAP